MKTLFAFSLLLPLIGGLGTKATGSNPKPDGPCSSYEYQYNNTMMYPITFYSAKRDESGAVRIAWLKDHAHEVTVIAGPHDLFERIDEIVEQYKLHRLKNTYTPIADVRDGYMWHAYIRFQKNSISTRGSNAWPKEKLWDGIKAINEYIQSVIDNAPESDFIETIDYRTYTKY